MRRFLHHVAKLTGERELTLAINHGGFAAQNRTADFGPGKSGHEADLALFMGKRVAELDDAKKVVHVLASDRDVVIRALFYDFAGNLAADVADFALQVTHAGFAGVIA